MNLHNPNYTYFAHYIKNLKNPGNVKVLDFGCGQGQITQVLRDNEIEAYGVDVYHMGSMGQVTETDLFKNNIIRPVKIGEPLPFADNYFDIIISNQVFEHVHNLDEVMSELGRVLKVSGTMYHRFPTIGVFREGHCGVPFAHWFKGNSKSQYYYIKLMRILGLGNYKEQHESASAWAKQFAVYLDEKCVYRTYKEIKRIFLGYHIHHREIDFAKYRLRHRPVLIFILNQKLLRPILAWAYQKYVCMDIELTKKF